MRGGRSTRAAARLGGKRPRTCKHRKVVDPAPGSRESIVMLGITAEIAAVLGQFAGRLDKDIRVACVAAGQSAVTASPMPVEDLGRLMRACADQTECLHFGLLVGQSGFLASLGLVGCLMPCRLTVAAALRNLGSHLQQSERDTAPILTVDDGMAYLTHATECAEAEGAHQIADGAMATAMNIMRSLCGPDWAPTEVLLPRPVPADLAPFTLMFRAPIRFEAGTSALVFPAKWLRRRVVTGGVLRCLFADRLGTSRGTPDVSFGDRVRRVLRETVPRGNVSAEEVARLFSMHRRTLDRHLQQEGLAFSKMVNEVRFEIARQLLTDRGLTMGQVAAALSFSEPSAFTRAFRRWSGWTPTAWRARQRAT